MGLRQMKKGRALFLGAAVCIMFASGFAGAGEIEEQGRTVLERYEHAVVTVQMVIKQKFSMASMGSHEQESQTEATGFVIDPSGLVVLSLATTDPSSMMESMMTGFGSDVRIETEMGDVKILLHDGTEIPARVVLRDRDLDLAFVRPLETPDEPLAAVDVDNSGHPQVLDQVVSLTRLGRIANRACAASFERVHAVVTRPRTFFVPSSEPTQTGLGSPIFKPDGRFVGMMALRVVQSSGGGGMNMMLGGMDNNIMSVIVPVEDIVEAAKQAVVTDEA